MFPQQLDALGFSLYEEAWEEFRRALEMDPKGKDSPSALVAALRLRQKASLLRCKHTAELCADLLEQGYQVAISVQFIETSVAIEEHLSKAGFPCSVINGGVSASDRESRRVAFQRGENSVALFTVTEGISLHAGELAVNANEVPRVLLLHDLRWSALDVAQIEGRCHRDGQNAAVWYLYAPDTAEEKVATAVLARLEDMGNMLGDDMSGLEALWSLV
jgi:SNF2 family DNA or RNA helicase